MNGTELLYRSAPSGGGIIIIINPFKFPLVFGRDGDNSRAPKTSLALLIPAFQVSFFFLSLLVAVVLESSVLEEI